MTKIENTQTHFITKLGSGLKTTHIVFLINELVEEFFEIYPEFEFESKKGGRKRKFFNRNLLAFIIFCYIRRIRSYQQMVTSYNDNNEAMKYLLRTNEISDSTISDFINDSPIIIEKFFEFIVEKCIKLGLVGMNLISIDGSFIKAQASNSNIISRREIKKLINVLKRLDFENKNNNLQKKLKTYFNNPETFKMTKDISNLFKKLNKNAMKFLEEGVQSNDLRNRIIKNLEHMLSLHTSTSKYKINCNDWEAVYLPNKRGFKSYNFNIQFATDSLFYIIVAVGISNDSNDKNQLINMILSTIHNLVRVPDYFVADEGYYLYKALFYCFINRIPVIIPDTAEAIRLNGKPGKKKNIFSNFKYDHENNTYSCKKGVILHMTGIIKSNKYYYREYNSKECLNCKYGANCHNYGGKGLREPINVIRDYFRNIFYSFCGQKFYKKRGAISETSFARMKELYNNRSFKRIGTENCLVILYLEALASNIRIMHRELILKNGKNIKKNHEKIKSSKQTTLV